MCGIAGVYGINDRSRFPEACGAVGRMVEAIAHRGPDSSGVWMEEDEVVLGHRRLSIIDTRTVSNQPFIDSTTGDVIVFNGEVYIVSAIVYPDFMRGRRFFLHGDHRKVACFKVYFIFCKVDVGIRVPVVVYVLVNSHVACNMKSVVWRSCADAYTSVYSQVSTI